MLTLTTSSGAAVQVHNDVRAITAARYQRFSAKFLEHSMGSDIFAAEGHLGRMALFLSGGNLESVKLEFNQLVLALSSIQEEANGPAVVLASLVESIDGRLCQDLTDGGLLETARHLVEVGVSQGQLLDTLDTAKKQLSATS